MGGRRASRSKRQLGCVRVHREDEGLELQAGLLFPCLPCLGKCTRQLASIHEIQRLSHTVHLPFSSIAGNLIPVCLRFTMVQPSFG